MKKAKVVNGLVHCVWPSVKRLPDGTEAVRVFPIQYQGVNGKPIPACIVDVPDEVQEKWVWDGEKYAPRVKKPRGTHSDMLEVIAEHLGVPYQELCDEIIARKKARKRAATKAN